MFEVMELMRIRTINDAEIVITVFSFQLLYNFLYFFAKVIKFSPCHLGHQKVSLIQPCIAEK